MSLKHMKSLIVLVLGLLSVGCLTPEQKQKALRDSMVGEYEFKNRDGDTYKYVFLDNGVFEGYEKAEWSIVDGEIHVKSDDREIEVCRINPDKSITPIAYIRDGEREGLPKEDQHTYGLILRVVGSLMWVYLTAPIGAFVVILGEIVTWIDFDE